MPQKITPPHSRRPLFSYGILAGISGSLVTMLVLLLLPHLSFAEDAKKPYEPTEIKKVQDKMLDAKTSFSNASSLYHQTINAVVNEYIVALFREKTVKDPPKADTDDAVAAACAVTGPTMNVSTYCLFLRIDPLYQKYREAVSMRSNTIIQDIQNLLKDPKQYDTTQTYEARLAWAKQELASSRKALDAVLGAYSELAMQYPLHKAYEKTLVDLVKYYHHLVDVRKKVDTYPKRFLDVTTAYCT